MISDALAQAIEHHRAGRLPAAEQIYRQILQAQPHHAHAMNLLGVIAYQVGQHEVAVDYIRRAIALQGTVADYHNNLANVYHASGRLPEAAASYRRALDLRPDLVEAHNNLGNVFKDQGLPEEAAACYRRAFTLSPIYAEAHSNLGLLLKAQGKLDEAIAFYRRALELKPDFADGLRHLGDALIELRRMDEAIASYRRVVELTPNTASAHSNLGAAYAIQGDMAAAVASFRRAVELEPDLPEGNCNLGLAFADLGRIEEAIGYYHRALRLKPDLAEAHNNLGAALREQGRLAEVEACFRRAAELKPGYDDARHNLGMFLLLRGRTQEGWREFEGRLSAPTIRRNFSKPRWDGERIEGRTLLIHNEQGIGDAIQFMRYVPLARARAGAQRVIVEARPALVRLFAASGFWADEIFPGKNSEEAALPRFDQYVPLMSLPLVLGLDEPMPMPEAYLRADPELHGAWRQRLRAAAARRVGLVWAGNPNHKGDRWRSIPLEMLRPLLQTPGCEFYSVQVGAQSAQTRLLQEAGLIDLTSHLTDFAETAAFISELDLIISVDTAVAHLAGAMGRSTWVLLPFPPDWCWGLASSDTPWYPSMRLFRQTQPGVWEPVVEEVAGALERFANDPAGAGTNDK